MKNKNESINKSTIIATVLLFGFIISVIPLLYVSFFTHPIADDYSFSYRVHDAISTKSSLLKAVFDTVSNSYNNWQGTFSAIAIFSLQPSVFSPTSYYLTTFLLIGALTSSTFFLFETIIKKLLHGKTSHSIILSCLTLLMSIQFVPDVHEAFYWFNGGSYYTLFYSLALVFFSLLLHLRVTEGINMYVFFVLSIILGIIIGGGNYTTALVTAELLTLITIIDFYQKSKSKWMVFIILLLFLVAFIINVMAPGNSVRAETVTSTNPIIAITQSLFYALVKIGIWTTLPQFVYIFAVVILSIFLIPKCSANFNHPVLSLGIAFALFASQMTPPLYAMSSIGAGRQIDIYYFSYYLLLAFTVFYLCGWSYRRLNERGTTDSTTKSLGLGAFVHKYLFITSITLCIIWGVGCFAYSFHKLASVQTTLSIMDGTLAQYNSEYETIRNTLESASGNIVIEDIKTIPPFLSNLGLSEDEENWENRAVARYFGVDSIKTPTN